MRDYVRDLYFHYFFDAISVSAFVPNASFEVMTALYAATTLSFSDRFTRSEKLHLSNGIKDSLFSKKIKTKAEQTLFNERLLKYYSIVYGFKPDGKWVFTDTFPMAQDAITSCVVLLGDYLCDKIDRSNLDSKFFRSFAKNTMSYLYDLFRAFSLQISILPCSQIVGSKYYSEAMYPVEDDRYYDAQFDRADRATDILPHQISLDVESQSGFFYGSANDPYTVTLNSCSCPDFKKRRLPCKHMYRLHDELEAKAETSNAHIQYYPLQPFSIPDHFPVSIQTATASPTQHIAHDEIEIDKPTLQKALIAENQPEAESETSKEKIFKEKLSNFFYAVFSYAYLLLIFAICPLLLIAGIKSCVDEHKENATHSSVTRKSTSTTNSFTQWFIPEQQNTTDYVLNTSSMIVHKPSCDTVPYINPDNYKTCKSLHSALNQGYQRCELCDPYESGITETKPSTTKRQSSATTSKRSASGYERSHTMSEHTTIQQTTTTTKQQQNTTYRYTTTTTEPYTTTTTTSTYIPNIAYSFVPITSPNEESESEQSESYSTDLSEISETESVFSASNVSVESSSPYEKMLLLFYVLMFLIFCILLALLYRLAHPKTKD